MTLDFRLYDLPLRHSFTISRYTVDVQKTMIVRIGDGEIFGYGEATANPYYHSTAEKLSSSIASVKDLVESLGGLPHPSTFWEILAPRLEDDYFALCAIDVAYWDFYARIQGRTLRSFFMGNLHPPMTSYTIGIDTIRGMQRKIAEMPWPVYKIKLGRGDDIDTVRKLRDVTDAVFRVDANAAWTAGEAIRKAEILKSLNVEFIEQPLPAGDTEGMKEVFAQSALPLIADESCRRFDDVDACHGLFHGINIKLMKCGGITPALRMIKQARELGLSVMAGCMTESTFGISALVQLAPLLDFIDADGPLLLSSDIASGATFEDGRIAFSENVGTGANPIAF